MIDTLWWLALGVAASAWCSAAEMGFTAANVLKIEHRARQGHRGARQALGFLRRPERFLGTILLCNNLANVAASALATYVAVLLWGDTGVPVAFAVITLVLLLFGEVLPKSILHRKANAFVPSAARVLRVMEVVVWPAVVLLTVLTDGLARVLHLGRARRAVPVTREAIRMMVREGRKGGMLTDHETDMINSVMELAHGEVREVMIPWGEVVALETTMTRSAVLRRARTSRFTRYPVCRDGELFGVLNVFDLFYSHQRWQRSVRLIRLVDGTSPLGPLGEMMRRHRETMVGVGMNGKVKGIATLEDIVERIVGDIENEWGRR